MKVQVLELPIEEQPDGSYKHPFMLVFSEVPQGAAIWREDVRDVISKSVGSRSILVADASIEVVQ